ncbi:hypothetical protein AK830_g11784 [Neonectria ditissima]|uniref:F-box domain-containing protein n=1 Tax=Neonectria ditissima TaxID=78410 RepID=A0A0P7B1V2_9HYPO|nr:hypothetical protein AK830_g11784 [Neonectria ditissima]
MARQLHLPLELILQIVEASLPTGGPQFVIDVSAPEAQLLVAWSQVCRATYDPATRLLRQHCMYIDSVPRLRKLLGCLSASKSYSSTSTLQPTISLGTISSIYLGLPKDTIPGPEVGPLMRDLFIELGSSIRRLILDLPYCTLPQDNIQPDCNQQLSEGLSALNNVEEFVTVGGLPTIDFWEDGTDFWERWPRLRRLAAFHVLLAEEALWHNIARTRALEQMVLARSLLLRVPKWNFKHAIGQHWSLKLGGDPTLERRMNILLADHEFSPPIIDATEAEIHDPQGLVSVSSFAVPIRGTTFVRTDHACREWMVKAAKEGTLWGHE